MLTMFLQPAKRVLQRSMRAISNRCLAWSTFAAQCRIIPDRRLLVLEHHHR